MSAIVEVYGAPGVGKSALFNDLWPPSIPWDRKPTPAEWRRFLDYARSIDIVVQPERWERMLDKATQKMATLTRRRDCVYAGVGFVQRGLDIAWRGPGLDVVEEFCRRMPVFDGAICLYADRETIRARNLERAKRKPHRQLSHLAVLNDEPREAVTAILRERGVPLLELDTRQPIAGNAARIRAFMAKLHQPAFA